LQNVMSGICSLPFFSCTCLSFDPFRAPIDIIFYFRPPPFSPWSAKNLRSHANGEIFLQMTTAFYIIPFLYPFLSLTFVSRAIGFLNPGLASNLSYTWRATGMSPPPLPPFIFPFILMSSRILKVYPLKLRARAVQKRVLPWNLGPPILPPLFTV